MTKYKMSTQILNVTIVIPDGISVEYVKKDLTFRGWKNYNFYNNNKRTNPYIWKRPPQLQKHEQR